MNLMLGTSSLLIIFPQKISYNDFILKHISILGLLKTKIDSIFEYITLKRKELTQILI